MDTLTKVEVEAALSARLPNCAVNCAFNPDGSLSVTVTAHDADQFTIANINRAHYHGESGINRLIREILEEMVISRQSSRRSTVG
jgi:molybdopterin/thiamine biosynthesis adenylyltransferase